jgi:hypothetical protein
MAIHAKKQEEADSPEGLEEDFHPKTEFEKALWRARQEFLRSGDPMLDADGLERELAERRGGVSEED